MPGKLLFRPKLILLDVYGTLLDMGDVQRRINYLLNSKRAYLLWMELLMQYIFVDNCTERFHDFTSIAASTLRMTTRALNADLSPDQVNEILEMLTHLPLKDHVQKGLSLLNDLDLRVAALTNSSEKIVKERMIRTGLISYFEKVLSVEQIKKYKPALQAYTWAADLMHVDPKNSLLVSSHAWDIAGADNAGMYTAYIENNQMFYPLAPEPGLTCKNLVDLAEQLSLIQAGH
jgi:2-haloacid dehalogenase